MKIKRFDQINENKYQDVKLVILIDDNGKKITKNGYAKEDVGIFDYEANEYPAGIDANGRVHASQVIDNRILRLDDKGYVPNLRMDKTYSPVYENKTEEVCYTETEVLELLGKFANELLFEYVDYQNSKDWAKSMGKKHAKKFFNKNKK